MTIDRDKLFLALLGATIVLTLAFGVGLAYDVATYRNAGSQTVAAGGPAAASADNGVAGAAADAPTATPGQGGPASGPGAVAGASSGSGGSTGGTSASSGGGGAAPQVAGAAPISAGNNQSVAASDTVLIGALITQSGPGNVSDGYKAMQAYVQWANAQGGINGHKLALDVKDDGGNPSVGRAAFQQIVQEDKVFSIVGECAPITDGVLVDEINQDQVPVVNDCLTAEKGYSSPYMWFNFLPSRTWQAISANYVYKHQSTTGIHKPYALCLDQATTVPYCDGFVQQWQKLGGSTCWSGNCASSGVGYDKYEIGTTRAQFESVAQQIKLSGADSIISFLEPTNQLSFMQALEDQQMAPGKPHDQGGFPQYAAIGMDQYVVQTIGDFAKGTLAGGYSAFISEMNFPGVQQIHDVMAKYAPGTPVDTYAQSEWNPITIFGEALRRMGSNVTRANLINVLNSGMADFSDGMQKPLGWTSKNHVGPLFTRWAQISGPSSYTLLTGWIDQNGNPTQ